MQGTSRRGRGRGKGRGKGRGREGYPIGTSASALAFAHSLLDDRSAPATASVLLLSWVPAWKQLAPHGPLNRREGEVRWCGPLNVTFFAQRELLRHESRFDAIALIHHVRSMQREQPLPRGGRAVNGMYSIEPPGWKPKFEPTHLAAFTRRFGLALSYEQAAPSLSSHTVPTPPCASLRAPQHACCVGRPSSIKAAYQGDSVVYVPRRGQDSLVLFIVFWCVCDLCGILRMVRFMGFRANRKWLRLVQRYKPTEQSVRVSVDELLNVTAVITTHLYPIA